MASGTLGVSLLEGKGRWLLAWLVYCTFTLRKIPLFSLTTSLYEVDGLVALLIEESSLPVVHVSCRELRGKPRAHPEFGSCTYSSSGFALVAACWKQRNQGAVGGKSPGALLPTSKPWLSCDLLPSKLGSCLRQSHHYLPWINNLNYWSPVSQIFPVLAALQPFNLLSSLITAEPGGISRQGRSSPFLHVFPWKGCRCETATTAGRGLEPTKRCT